MTEDNRIIFCKYFKKELPALPRPPLNGDLGQYLFENISKKAWFTWVPEQVKYINENQLSLKDHHDREKLKAKMLEFFHLENLNKS